MNTLIKTQNGIPVSNDGGWDNVPVDNGSLIRGAIIKFNSGTYFWDGNSLEPDAEFFVTGVLHLWIRWDNRKPVEFIIAEQKLPKRETLSYLDKETWPPGMNGQPADPWCETYYIYGINTKTAADATFTTHTAGGHKAVKVLGGAIRNMQRSHPGAVPIIKLGTVMMPTGYGDKPRPNFEIINWKIVEPPARTMPAAVPPAAVPAAVHEETAVPIREDMEDEIPF
jgi:hypothetical protein